MTTGRAIIRAVAAAAALLLPHTGSAASGHCAELHGTATVVETDGFASVTLSSGEVLRLGGVLPGEVADPRAAPLPLGALVGEAVSATIDPGTEGDRYGRIVGGLTISNTLEPFRERILREGLALVDPAGMSDACLDGLFAAERAAEANGRGVWGLDGFVRGATDARLAEDAGAYRLVAGQVKSVGVRSRSIFLNFGNDFSTDFTVIVPRDMVPDAADSIAALSGRNVRIRGVLEAWNGALIRIEHLRQIEMRPAPGGG